MFRRIFLLALTACLGCAALNRDIAESPACVGLTLGDAIQSDVALVTQLIADIPQENLVGAIQAFSQAKGKQQAECVYDIVEAQLGHPIATVDAGVSTVTPTALTLAMGKQKIGALEALTAFRAARAAARSK